MQEEAGDLLKSGNHLALSNRQDLNRFALMLTYPRPIHFLYPMGNGVFVARILCAKELIGKGIKRDRRTIRPNEHDRITVTKRIGPTGAPVILDRSLSQEGSNILRKRFPVERLVGDYIWVSKALG